MDILFVLGIGLLLVALYLLVRRRRQLNEVTVEDVVESVSHSYTADHQVGARPNAYYTPAYYNPGVTVVQANSGFSDGLLLGAMLNEGPRETVIIEQPVYEPAPVFSGFGGGDSAGGGASSSWDSGSSSSDYSSSSSDYSSSCDSSSSYDSGSSCSSGDF